MQDDFQRSMQDKMCASPSSHLIILIAVATVDSSIHIFFCYFIIFFINKVIISIRNQSKTFIYQYIFLYSLHFKACQRNVLSFCIVLAIRVPKSFGFPLQAVEVFFVCTGDGVTEQIDQGPPTPSPKYITNSRLASRKLNRDQQYGRAIVESV